MKKNILVMLALASTSLAIAGCGSGKNEESKADKDTIKWAVWDVKKSSVEHELVAAFEKENPGKQVELTSIGSADYQDKVTTMLASGDTTDLITIKNARQYGALSKSNALLDVTEDIESSSNKEKAPDAFEAFYMPDGRAYAQPIKADSWYLFYNKDIFDEKGIAYPENLTWDEYIQLAGKLTDEKEDIYGSYQVVWPSVVQAPAYAQSDVDYVKADYSWLKNYYQVALDLQDKGYAQDFATNSTGSEAGGHGPAFEGGQAAMLVMGTWYVQDLIGNINAGDTDINWGLAQLPQNEGVSTPETAAAFTGIAVNKNSKNQELAKQFAEFLSSEEAAEIYASKGVFPAISSEKTNAKLLEIEGMATDDGTKAVLNAEKKLKSELPIGESVSDVNTILEEEHTLIMTGEVSLSKGIEEMNSRVKELE
jgi:multiple sugar transport system substrate-binding protein